MTAILKRALLSVLSQRTDEAHVHFHSAGMYGEPAACFEQDCRRPHLDVR